MCSQFLMPYEVVAKRFKDFIIDPGDTTPVNVMFLACRERFEDLVILDFLTLSEEEYIVKYCNSTPHNHPGEHNGTQQHAS